MTKKRTSAVIASSAIPPTTPPTIGPTGTLLPLEVDGLGVGVTVVRVDGVLVAAVNDWVIVIWPPEATNFALLSSNFLVRRRRQGNVDRGGNERI